MVPFTAEQLSRRRRQLRLPRRSTSRALQLVVALLAAAIAALCGTAFVASGRRAARGTRLLTALHADGATAVAEPAVAEAGKSRCPYSKENMAMEGAPDAEGGGLLPGERYIAMNRFQVRDGAGPQFEQRWAQRKSSLMELDGFRWFSLMRRVPPTGEDESFEYPDEYNYVSFTIWETKKNFNSWRKGPAFQEAHGGGDIFAFVSMIINGFMTSKGPPKPAFWRGMLMEKTAEEKQRLMSGPGGRPDADGQNLLSPEVFVSMNRFTVAEGREKEFEERWAKRESKLQNQPGFRFFQLMRRDQTPDDDVNYISMAAWDDREAFNGWRQGEGFKKAHGGGEKKSEAPERGTSSSPMGGVLLRPPKPYFYEGKLVLESEQGA